MNFTDLVRNAGVEKNALGRRRFASINVRHDADIPIALNGYFAGHD